MSVLFFGGQRQYPVYLKRLRKVSPYTSTIAGINGSAAVRKDLRFSQ
jgi:hypothetical protein